MGLNIEHLDSFIMYVGVLVLAAPLLLWLFFRVARPTVAWNGTAESRPYRMVPLARRGLHHLMRSASHKVGASGKIVDTIRSTHWRFDGQ